MPIITREYIEENVVEGGGCNKGRFYLRKPSGYYPKIPYARTLEEAKKMAWNRWGEKPLINWNEKAPSQEWKGKKIGDKDPKIEIRKCGSNGAQMLLVVHKDTVRFSSNGRITVNKKELLKVLELAEKELQS